MKQKLQFTEQPDEPTLFRLDLGTGKGMAKPEGFVGVDLHKWNGNQVVDLRGKWPWKKCSVDEVNAAYILHLFTPEQRVHFANELYRVLKPEAKAAIFTPYWCAAKAYTDPLAQWPPISEAWYQTLNKAWREAQNYVDATGLNCDFDFTVGYGMHPLIVARNQEYQQHAIAFWKEASQDLVCTLTRRG